MTEALRSRMDRFVEFINSADNKIGAEVISPSATFHVPFLPEPVQGPGGYLEIIGSCVMHSPTFSGHLKKQ